MCLSANKFEGKVSQRQGFSGVLNGKTPWKLESMWQSQVKRRALFFSNFKHKTHVSESNSNAALYFFNERQNRAVV